MPEAKPPESKIELVISWATIFQILAACLLSYLVIELWRFLELLFLSLLIALTLLPIVSWTRKKEWPKWTGVAISSFLLLGVVALLVGVLLPTVVDQSTALIKGLPVFKEEVLKRLPQSGPIYEAVQKLLNSDSFSDPEPLLKQFMAWGTVAVTALVEFLVVIVVAIYFVADGERIAAWITAFFPSLHRKKMIVAAPEVVSVVGSYMIGQLITSLLCGAYAFAVLKLLHVPNAALLAALAGMFDVLPMVGFILSLVPALAFALTISPATSGLVLVLYVVYHMVENYFIVPKIYGDRLRLSTLTVLVSCMAAGIVAGVVGAIAVLPLVAIYPILERLWLRPHLESDTVLKHEAIDAEAHPE